MFKRETFKKNFFISSKTTEIFKVSKLCYSLKIYILQFLYLLIYNNNNNNNNNKKYIIVKKL